MRSRSPLDPLTVRPGSDTLPLRPTGLLEEADEWWALLDAAPDFVSIVDRDGRILYINHSLPEYTVEHVLGTSLYQYMPRDQHATVRESLARVFHAGATDRHEVAAAGGATRLAWYENRVVPIKQDGRVVAALIISTDVTERQQKLRGLSRQLLEAHEAERSRIARELHDQVGQALTAVKLNVEALHRAALEPGRAVPFTETVLAIERAMEDVRALSFELRPALLDDLGLPAAVSAYAKRQAERAGLELGLAVRSVPPGIPKHVEIACFRVLQETVTNVMRHSGARRLEVALRTEDGGLLLEVRDDGRGFDARAWQARGASHRHLGLLGMQERAGLVGGVVAVESQPGAGAVVRARFPLAARDGDETA